MEIVFITIQILLGLLSLVLLVFWGRIWIKSAKMYFRNSSDEESLEEMRKLRFPRKLLYVFLGLLIFSVVFLLFIYYRKEFLF